MASILEIETGRTGYVDTVQHVIKHGRRRSPRGLATLDAGHTTIVIHDPRFSLPTGCGRNVSERVAAVEAVQLIGGFSDTRLTRWAAPGYIRYAEDNGEYHGAYGRRIGTQLGSAIRKIKRDHETRQAVINLWDSWLDNTPGKRDYPCTIALRLSMEDDKLDLDVVMRSNDVWLGTPYDWFQFSQLQLTAARLLDVEAGLYRHTVWSLHIYETDLERVDELTRPRDTVEPVSGLGRSGDTVITVMRRAQTLIRPDLHLPDAGNPELTDSERWYRDQLINYATFLG